MPGRTEGVTTTYHIEVLGKLWMGGLAAYQYTIEDRNIKVGDEGTFAGDLWLSPDLNELQNVQLWLSVNSSDFQSINAARIVRSERKTIQLPDKPGLIRDGKATGPWKCQEVRSRDTLLIDFNEEAAQMYDKCMISWEID